MKQSNLFIIGAGVIARHHLTAACRQLHSRYELKVNVCDKNTAALDTTCDEFTQQGLHIQAWNDAQSMLDAQAPEADDIVIIATPPASHKTLAIQALRSGRHVLCEKPLAMNAGEALEMLAAAKESDKYLGCCSIRFAGPDRDQVKQQLLRLNPYHAVWRDLRPRSRTGIEYQPQSPWFAQRSLSGGGCLIDWGPYDICLLNYLLDPVAVEVREAWIRMPVLGRKNLPASITPDVETHVGATLVYQLKDRQDLLISYERASGYHGPKESLQRFEGDTGSLVIDLIGHQPATLITDTDGQPQEETIPDINNTDPGLHDRPLLYFHNLIQGLPSCALVNESAIFNFLVMQAIYSCAHEHVPQVVSRCLEPNLTPLSEAK